MFVVAVVVSPVIARRIMRVVFTMAVGEYRSTASTGAQALITEQPFKATEIRYKANELQAVDISQTDISESGVKL